MARKALTVKMILRIRFKVKMNSPLLVGTLVATTAAFLAYQTLTKSSVKNDPERKNKVVVGIDLGATNAKAGVVSADGTLLASASAPLKSLDPNAVVESLVAVVHEAVALAGLPFNNVVAVGVGSPGHIFDGVVKAASNFPVCDMY